MTTIQSNQKILKVLRKMDDVLHRYGINHYQERIHRIHKILLSIEIHSNCYVSNFSLDNCQNNNNEYANQFSDPNQSHLETNKVKDEIKVNLSNQENQINQTTTMFINTNKGESENFQQGQINSPIKKRLSYNSNFSFCKDNIGISDSNEKEINNTIKTELDELFKFIEDELKQENLLSMQESTQFTSNSEDENSNNKISKEFITKNESSQMENAFTDFALDNDSEPQAKNNNEFNSCFISAMPNAKKDSKNKQKKKFDILNFYNLNSNNNDNNILNENSKNDLDDKNEFICKQKDIIKCESALKQGSITSAIKTEKKFSSSNKQKENAEKNFIKNFNKNENVKQDFKNIFAKIETKLKTYLREAQNQKIFESKAFESFLNEDKLKTPSSFYTAKSQTPSIIKNFFEDKEVIIEITKKRHSVAGEVIKNQLEKIKDLEIKQKCLSNFREENYLNDLKDISRKKSDISDFSINLSENSSNNNDSNSKSGNEISENVNEFGKRDSNQNEGNSFIGRMSGIKLSKRGSILRERLNIMKFDVVKEEKNLEIEDSGDENKN